MAGNHTELVPWQHVMGVLTTAWSPNRGRAFPLCTVPELCLGQAAAPDVLLCLQHISCLKGQSRIIRAGQSLSAGWGNLQTFSLPTLLSQRESLIRGIGEIHLGGREVSLPHLPQQHSQAAGSHPPTALGSSQPCVPPRRPTAPLLLCGAEAPNLALQGCKEDAHHSVILQPAPIAAICSQRGTGGAWTALGHQRFLLI